MSTYLPKDGSSGSAYQEGGGLFALGKTFVNYMDWTSSMIVNFRQGYPSLHHIAVHWKFVRNAVKAPVDWVFSSVSL